MGPHPVSIHSYIPTVDPAGHLYPVRLRAAKERALRYYSTRRRLKEDGSFSPVAAHDDFFEMFL